MAQTAGQVFYEEQVAAIVAKDLDAIMAHYSEDASLIRFDGVIQGKAALREYFVGYLEQLGSLQLLSTDNFVETPDSIFFEATMRVKFGVARVYDIFMLKDGRATHHFSGVISVTNE